MARNSSDTEEKELTPKQEQLIAALVAGNSVVVAAKVAGVGERTAHTWLKQPAFKRAYQQAKQIVFEEALDDLRDNVSEAIKTLTRNMTSDTVDPAVQVRAAHIILTQSIQVHRIEELEAELQEIKAIMKENHGYNLDT